MDSRPAHRIKGKADQPSISHGKVDNRGAPGTRRPQTRMLSPTETVGLWSLPPMACWSRALPPQSCFVVRDRCFQQLPVTQTADPTT